MERKWLVVKPFGPKDSYIVVRATFRAAGWITGVETDETRCGVRKHSFHESFIHCAHDDFLDAWKQTEDMRAWLRSTRS